MDVDIVSVKKCLRNDGSDLAKIISRLRGR